MENSTNERQDNREMDRRTVVLKGAAVAAGALCGASALGLAGCSTPMADTGEQTSMDELMKKMQELEDRLWVAEAKEEIRYKLCMYARGDDRQDAAIGKPVYAEDSYVDFGTSPEFGEVPLYEPEKYGMNKRGRGRPRKSEDKRSSSSPQKRNMGHRGRPKKVQ